VAAITGNLVKLGSDQGVFASIDWQIRDITEAIERIDAEGVAKDQEEAHINSALTLPWDQAERYVALQAELEALNAELSKANDNRAAQPTNRSAQDTPTVAADADTGALEVVETSDVDATALEVAAVWPLLPPAALPEPSDLAAMETAMAQLAATHDLTEAEEVAIAAELVDTVDAEEQTGAATAEAAMDVLEQPIALEIQPRTIVLAQADVVRVPRASRSTLVFGSHAHIGLVKGKRTKTAKATNAPKAELATTIDVFAVADTPARLQLALF
jgi:hypothetical protein